MQVDKDSNEAAMMTLPIPACLSYHPALIMSRGTRLLPVLCMFPICSQITVQVDKDSKEAAKEALPTHASFITPSN